VVNVAAIDVKKKKSNGSNYGDCNELKGAAHEQDALIYLYFGCDVDNNHFVAAFVVCRLSRRRERVRVGAGLQMSHLYSAHFGLLVAFYIRSCLHAVHVCNKTC
jgi:hypothetical protein